MPYNFGIRHSLFDIRYSLFVAVMVTIHCRYWLNSYQLKGRSMERPLYAQTGRYQASEGMGSLAEARSPF
jgi:hypothetical protein